MAQEILGFTTQYIVNKVTSIKPTASGAVNGQKYDASVKVRSSMIELKNDEFLGLVEKETNIEFNIPCDDKNLRDFNTWLRKQQKDNTPIIITAGLPYSGDSKSVLVTKSYLTGEEMMAKDKKTDIKIPKQ